jgi:hypothetical protein
LTDLLLQACNQGLSDANQEQSVGSMSEQYAGVGSGHWIQKVSSNGSIITLEDNSTWEVNSIDRIYTTLWLPITEITVLHAENAIGQYKYRLVNTDDGESVLAKYLGK